MKATEKVTVDGVIREYDMLDVDNWLREQFEQAPEDTDIGTIKANVIVASVPEAWLVSWEEQGERIFLYGMIAPIEGEWVEAN